MFEKQQRRKVWQAVLLQDTFLTVLLSLPPSATHTDVNVEELEDDTSSIAHSIPTDTAYIRGSWTLANLVQETICSPRSLDVPICTTARHKSKLVADFRAVYRSFPDVFRSWDADSLAQLALKNKRVVRQTLFLSSNYFHNLMLVHASESPDVPVNVRVRSRLPTTPFPPSSCCTACSRPRRASGGCLTTGPSSRPCASAVSCARPPRIQPGTRPSRGIPCM